MPAGSLATFTEVRGSLRSAMLVQDIFDIRLTPTPEAVDVEFALTFAVQPVVEVFIRNTGQASGDMITENLRGVAFSFDPRARHRLRVHNLSQDRRYWFRITAADILPHRPPAHAFGHFRTARRDVTLRPHDVAVFLDGDPSSEGEMWFSFGVYATAGPLLAGPLRYPDTEETSIPDGKIVTLEGGLLSVNRAPDEIAIYVQGYDEDDDCFFGFSTTGAAMPDTDPLAPSHAETCQFANANAYLRRALPEKLGPFTDRVTLDSGRWAIHYKINVAITGSVTLAEQPVILSTPIAEAGVPSRKAGDASPRRARGTGNHAEVEWSDRAIRITLGHDGTVYQLAPSRYRGDRRWSNWVPLGHRLAGAVSLLGTAEGVHLIGVTAQGVIVHSVVRDRPEITHPPEWRRLGSGFTGDVTAVATTEPGAVDLFAVGVDRSLRHLRLRGESHRPDASGWTDLGGFVDGPVAVARGPQPGLLLVALTTDGEVRCRQWRANGADEVREAWHSLGGPFAGPIVALTSEGRWIDVVVADEARCLHHKRWDGTYWDPPGPRWTELLCLDGPALSTVRWPDHE